MNNFLFQEYNYCSCHKKIVLFAGRIFPSQEKYSCHQKNNNQIKLEEGKHFLLKSFISCHMNTFPAEFLVLPKILFDFPPIQVTSHHSYTTLF